jgi:uncharacterized protein (DUF58 family)
MPTRRGAGLLIVALGTYLGGRLVGTYELYMVALALVALVAVSCVLVLITGTRLRLERTVRPTTPTAGDVAELEVRLRNRSLLPTAPLRLTQPLAGLRAGELLLDASPLSPRSLHVSYLELAGLRRGRFTLPPMRVTVVDPLGIARRHTQTGEPLELLVLPEVVRLRSCVFFGHRELGQGRRALLSPVSAALDLRGVRPHQPGEPLSHIDWKATAKVGSLMLKEMEEPGRNDVVLVLDGTDRMHVGVPPDDSFEAAVAAVGSIGDYVLREGFSVSLLLHGERDTASQIDPGDRSRRELLLALAEAEADAGRSVSTALEGQHNLVSRGLAVVVVSTDTGRDLLQQLIDLRERGTAAYLVHVDASSFARTEGAAAPDIRDRSFLLELQHHGIPSLTLRRGDPIEEVLAFSERDGRGRRAAAARDHATEGARLR